MTLPGNITLYVLICRAKDGDLFAEEWTFASVDGVINWLSESEEDGRCVHIIRLDTDERGLVEHENVTETIARRLAAEARMIDDTDEGLPADERPWVHPLAFDLGGFRWTPNEHELIEQRAEHRADVDRDCGVL